MRTCIFVSAVRSGMLPRYPHFMAWQLATATLSGVAKSVCCQYMFYD
jgi:hypothetical protein